MDLETLKFRKDIDLAYARGLVGNCEIKASKVLTKGAKKMLELSEKLNKRGTDNVQEALGVMMAQMFCVK